MDKSIWTLLAVVIIAALACIIMQGFDEKEFNKTILIRANGGPGCCQVRPDSCASGHKVTEEACEEMAGTFFEDQICNLQTGKCE